MLIAHISDLHINRPNEKAYGVVPTDENLISCVKHINQLKPQPDVVLVTGDITGNALKEEMHYAEKILSNLTVPFFVIPGNHDSANDVIDVFGKKHCPASANGFVNYVIEDYPLRLIGLDSTAKGLSGGEFCEVRASWLENCLNQNTTKPTILFIHHPPLEFGIYETDKDGFTGVDLLADVVRNHNNIERILCGHIHNASHSSWCGTIVSASPSMGLQLVVNLHPDEESKFVKDEASYLLHYWTPKNNLITHNISLHKTSKPCPFEGLDHE